MSTIISYLDFQRIYNLFNKYFRTVSYIQGRDPGPIPFLTNNEYYTVLDTFTKYQRYYQEVILQPVFDTTEANKLFETIFQDAASLKSIFSKFKDLSDPFKVSGQELDNLLLSFGFPILNFPEYTKRQLLLNLVSNYKIKGTLNSLENILNILLPTRIKISEIYFKKIDGHPYFVETIPISVPGFYDPEHEIRFPIDSLTPNDPHWWLPTSNLQNWPIGKAMSPYFSINSYINTLANLAAIILLRTYAQNDYNVYLTGTSEEYDATKQITVNNLPLKINYLELYELIRYIIIKQKNLEGSIDDDPNKRNYSYNPPDEDYDIIVDEINAQFNTRYDNSFGDIVSETKNCIYESVIHSVPLCRMPGQAEAQTFTIPDLIGATSIVWNNKILLVGGKFQSSGVYNTRLYIIDGYSTTNIYHVDIGIKLTYPIISVGENCWKLCITGGYDEFGNKNYRSWAVDLTNYSVTQISDIPEKLWMDKPIVVSTPNDLNFVISTNDLDNCPGGIYIWNICGNYKKLLAFLNPAHYDLSTIKAVCDSKSRLYIVVKSRLSGGTRIVFLDPHPNYEIFVDITCQVIKNIPDIMKPEFTRKLFEENIMLTSYGNKVFIIYRTDSGNLAFHEIQVQYTESNDIKKKLVPRYFSGMLIPSRICRPCTVYRDSIPLYQDFCNFNFYSYGLDITEIQQYGDYYFVNVRDRQNGEKCYYWPLMKQIYTLCCNSSEARITKILPPVYNIIYDSVCVYDIWGEFDPNCFFYFICWNPDTNSIGEFENVDNFTFEDVFRLSHAEHLNDHFCYNLYDSCHDYDIENPVRIVAYSNYPDITSSLESNPHYSDLLNIYSERHIPEYVVIDFLYYFLSFDFYLCAFDGQNRYAISSGITTYSLHYEDSSGTIINILNVYPKILKLIAITCEMTYTEDEDLARGFRQKMLDEREDKLINDTEVLPVFHSFEELSQFLSDVTYDNKLAIDSSENPEEILYELLMIASSLYPNADLTMLFPEYSFSQIKPILDIFKPIHSRETGVTIFMMVPDPIGDWITLENSIEFQYLKSMTSWIKMDDCFVKALAIVLRDWIHVDHVHLIDRLEIIPAIVLADYISLNDLINVLHQNVSQKLYDNLYTLVDELQINKSVKLEDIIGLVEFLHRNITDRFYDYIGMSDYFNIMKGLVLEDDIRYIHDLIKFYIQKKMIEYMVINERISFSESSSLHDYSNLFDELHQFISILKDSTIHLHDIFKISRNIQFTDNIPRFIDEIKRNISIKFTDMNIRDRLYDLIDIIQSILLHDSITLSDQIFKILNRTFEDSLRNLHDFLYIGGNQVTVTEYIGLLDELKFLITKYLIDNINTNDYLKLVFLIKLEDICRLLDSIKLRITKKLHDSIMTNDVADVILGKILQDYLGLSENVHFYLRKKFHDYISKDDELRATLINKLEDFLNFSDEIHYVINKSIHDPVSLSDSTKVVGLVKLFDSILKDDLIKLHVTKKIIDVINFNDNINIVKGITLSDYLNIIEDIHFRVQEKLRSYISLTDDLKFSITKKLIDVITFNDEFQAIPGTVLSDYLNIVDDLFLSIKKKLHDYTNLNEKIKFSILKKLLDTLNINEFLKFHVGTTIYDNTNLSDEFQYNEINLVYDTTVDYDDHWWGPIPI